MPLGSLAPWGKQAPPEHPSQGWDCTGGPTHITAAHPPTPGAGAAHPLTAITAPTPVGPARGVQGQGAIYASMPPLLSDHDQKESTMRRVSIAQWIFDM